MIMPLKRIYCRFFADLLAHGRQRLLTLEPADHFGELVEHFLVSAIVGHG